MTNQLETAKEWLSDLNKIIDKTDNECTKQKRDVLEWLVESVEVLKKDRDALEVKIDKAYRDTQRYKQALERIINIDGRFTAMDEEFDSNIAYDWVDEIARQALKGESQ